MKVSVNMLLNLHCSAQFRVWFIQDHGCDPPCGSHQYFYETVHFLRGRGAGGNWGWVTEKKTALKGGGI